MQSRIAEAVRLKHQPVAILLADEAPAEAMRFDQGKWGCVMWLAASAAKGRPGACDKDSFGCFGGGVGLGFGNQYRNFPGGEEGFCRFLSTGNADWETGRLAADAIRPFVRPEFLDHFLHGERYMKGPEQARQFMDSLPMTQIDARYVVFQPLAAVDPARQKPQSVIFFADPDQLSALVVLANYGRGENENVIIPWAAGCQTMGIYPFRELQREKPRAVVGMTDLSARLYLLKQLGGNLLSMTVPWLLLEEMEGHVEGSFLEGHTWQELLAGKGQ